MMQAGNKKKTIRGMANRSQDVIPWRYCILTFGCGLLLAIGFFFAARMHFSAIDYGMRNAKLRRQKESLEADQRRFVVAKEIAMSPQALNKAARKIGLESMTFESKSSAQNTSVDVSKNRLGALAQK